MLILLWSERSGVVNDNDGDDDDDDDDEGDDVLIPIF